MSFVLGYDQWYSPMYKMSKCNYAEQEKSSLLLCCMYTKKQVSAEQCLHTEGYVSKFLIINNWKLHSSEEVKDNFLDNLFF